MKFVARTFEQYPNPARLSTNKQTWLRRFGQEGDGYIYIYIRNRVVNITGLLVSMQMGQDRADGSTSWFGHECLQAEKQG